MKKTERMQILPVLLACGMLTGCQLAVADSGTTQQDRLIGVYVTTEPVAPDGKTEETVPGEPVGTEVMVSGTSADGERLYGVIPETSAPWQTPLGEDWRQAFPGTTGYALCMVAEEENGVTTIRNGSDPAYGKLGSGVTDNESERIHKQSGTLYLDLSKVGKAETPRTVWINPVYRTQDKRFYLTEGEGISWDSSEAEGASYSYSVREKISESFGEEAQAETTEITVNLAFVYAAQEVAVYQFDEAYGLMEHTIYPAAELPESLDFLPDAQTVLLESRCTDSEGILHTERWSVGRHDSLTDYDGVKSQVLSLPVQSEGLVAEQKSVSICLPAE